MKLYSKFGVCFIVDYIVLQWIGQLYDVELLIKEILKVFVFLVINLVGLVLVVVDGDFVLIQNVVIMGYIVDIYFQVGLVGDGSVWQCVEVICWLFFVNLDLYLVFLLLFGLGNYIGDESQYDVICVVVYKCLCGLFECVNMQLEGCQWLVGFCSFVDLYFYIMLCWVVGVKVDLIGLDNIVVFKQCMDVDLGVQVVLKVEGLF